MSGGQEKDDIRSRPRLSVVEGAQQADPAALDDALALLVTWALRAHEARCPETDDAVS